MKKYVLYASVSAFILSLFLPGFYSEPGLNNSSEVYFLCRSLNYNNSQEMLANRNGLEESCFYRKEVGGGVTTNCSYDQKRVKEYKSDPRNIQVDANGKECKDAEVRVSQSMGGWRILFLGFLAVLLGISFAWLANLAYVLAFILLLFRRYTAALGLSIFGFLVGLDSFRLRRIPSDDGYTYIDHLAIGFYVWMFALVLQVVYLYLLKKEKSSKTII